MFQRGLGMFQTFHSKTQIWSSFILKFGAAFVFKNYI